MALPVFWGTDASLGEEGYLQNLSASGGFLETQQPEPLGTHLYLWFELPFAGIAKPVKASATVAHVVPPGRQEPPGMGIAFETSKLDPSVLERFLDARLGGEPAPEITLIPEPLELEPASNDTEAAPATPVPQALFPSGKRIAMLILTGTLVGLLLYVLALLFAVFA